MASYMALKEGWVDADGKVEPIEFKGEHNLVGCLHLTPVLT